MTVYKTNGQDMEQEEEHDCKNYAKAIATYIWVIKAEIEYLKTTLEPHGMGHIHTTITTLQHRVKELEKEHTDNKRCIH